MGKRRMTAPPIPPDPGRDAYISALLDRAAAIRLPELFQGDHSDSLWRVRDRHAVSTIVIRTASLTREQLVAIMTYRLAQYLMANHVDPHPIHTQGLAHEPLSGARPDTDGSACRENFCHSQEFQTVLLTEAAPSS